MQVSVEDLGDLERRMTVQVPAEQIEPEVEKRLKSLSGSVKVRGFRPGKVPFKMLKRMYGAQVRQEVVGEMLQSTYAEALEQEQLNPLGTPSIEPKNLTEGEDLEYSATFEVLPKFELSGIEGLKIERPVAEVVESDIDDMLDNLRRQRAVWTEVERPAQEGDQVKLDFEGTRDGEDFVGSKSENATLVLGSGAMVKVFEEALIGLQRGAETEFDATYPEDYPAADMAGKQVHFKVKLHSVAESRLPEIDEEFIALFDIKEAGIEALRQETRKKMEHQLQQGIRASLRQQVTQGLLDANAIPIPRILVEQEIENLAKQANLSADIFGGEEAFKAAKVNLFEPTARRTVALGLIMSDLIEINNIELDDARVQTHLDSIASDYQDAAEVRQWFENNPQILAGVQATAHEDQVLDWLLERAEIIDKPSNFKDIMSPKQSPEAVSQESQNE